MFARTQLEDHLSDTICIEGEPIMATCEFEKLVQVDAELFDDAEPTSKSGRF